jgi:hypothetical protein
MLQSDDVDLICIGSWCSAVVKAPVIPRMDICAMLEQYLYSIGASHV